VSEIPELDRKGLRRFGLLLAGLFAAAFGLLLPWFKDWRTFPNGYALTAAGLIMVWSFAAPQSIRPLYRAWMWVATIIGEVVNRVVLAAVYFLVILPLAMAMRLLGRDPLRRRFDPNAQTYRIKSRTMERNHMERPF